MKGKKIESKSYSWRKQASKKEFQEPESHLPQHTDTWDLPEFDDNETNSDRYEECRTEFDILHQIPHADSESLSPKAHTPLTADVAESKDQPLPDISTKSNEDQTTPNANRRRSFCSFHYLTTQGGSSTVDSGNDPSI
jgi:hypothetical protein